MIKRDNFKEQEFISDVDTIESMLKKVECVLSQINSKQFSILVRGMGKHPKSTYKFTKYANSFPGYSNQIIKP